MAFPIAALLPALKFLGTTGGAILGSAVIGAGSSVLAGSKQAGAVERGAEASIEEQRSTPWMTYHSLSNFLDPDDASKSIEGYPAPRRAVVTANAPGEWLAL